MHDVVDRRWSWRLWIGLGLVVFGLRITECVKADDIVVVVLDDSGSMNDIMATRDGRMSRMDAAKRALEKVVERLPQETQLGILLLNGVTGNQNWLVPLKPLNVAETRSRIQSVRARGGTPLGAAMQKGINELLQARAKQVYGTYRLVVVSDGEANDSRLLQSLLPEMVSRGVVIDVIGVAMKEKHSLSERSHSYRNAADPAQFEQVVQEVFAEATLTQDGDASDFEMIAPLPEEFAREAITALGMMNRLVGSNEMAGGGERARQDPPLPMSVSQAPVDPGVVATKVDNPGRSFPWVMIMVAVWAGLFVAVQKKKKRVR